MLAVSRFLVRYILPWFIRICGWVSAFGIFYYTLWVLVLVLGSIREPWRRKRNFALAAGYHLYVMMPMLNEAGVVNSTLSKFLENTTSIDQITLLVIDDGSDDGTGDLIKQFIAAHHCEKKIALLQRFKPNAQTGKGNALNFGLNYIRKLASTDHERTIVGVLDADAVMKEKDFKNVILEYVVHPQLALLQTKVRMIKVHNWLELMQDVEFATVNDWIQRVRNVIGNAAASGNGQFIRLSAMDDKQNPWGNALLEDFEFSTNFLLKGAQTKYCSDIVVYQEAVNKTKPFIRQRSRWVQGGLDCAQKYFSRVVKSPELGFWAKFEMVFFMLLPFFTVLVGFSNLIILLYACGHFVHFIGLFVFLLGAVTALSYYMAFKYALNDFRISPKLVIICSTMTIYNVILFPAILIAFYRKITGASSWIKTAHGVQS